MGILTEDLTRLRQEILALRNARQGLIHDLEQGTGDRRAQVSEMLRGFSKGLRSDTKRTRTSRLASLQDLKSTVANLRAEVQKDLSGTRQSWQGRRARTSVAMGQPSGPRKPGAGDNGAGKRSRTGGKRHLTTAGGEKRSVMRRKH